MTKNIAYYRQELERIEKDFSIVPYNTCYRRWFAKELNLLQEKGLEGTYYSNITFLALEAWEDTGDANIVREILMTGVEKDLFDWQYEALANTAEEFCDNEALANEILEKMNK